MRNVITLFVLMAISFTVIAQTNFQQFYGTPNTSDIAYGGVETASGDILMLNRINNPNTGSYDMQLMLLDAFGEQIWIKTYETQENEEILDILQLASGDYLLSAVIHKVNGSHTSSIWKIDATGEIIWKNNTLLEDRILKDFLVNDNGNILLLSQAEDNRLISIDENQAILWERILGDAEVGVQVMNSISPTEDGGYVLAGAGTDSSHPEPLILLYKSDSQGNKEWVRLYNNPLDISDKPVGKAAIQTSDGGYFIMATTQYFAPFRQKTNAEGQVVWGTNPSFGSYTDVFFATEVSDGGILMFTGAGGSVAKYNVEGELEWFNPTQGATHLKKMIVTANGNYMSFGYISEFNDSYEDIYVNRFDEGGENLWEKIYGVLGGYDPDVSNSMALTSDNTLLVFGNKSNNNMTGRWSLWAMDADNGQLEWNQEFGGDVSIGVEIFPIGDDTFLLLGYSFQGISFIKINAEGESIWRKDYDYNIVIPRSNVIAKAESEGFLVLINSFSTPFLIRLDKDGNLLWEKSLYENHFFTSLTDLNDGSFLLTGNSTMLKSSFVAKIDKEGLIEWEKYIGSEEPDFDSSIVFEAVENKAGNIVVVRSMSFAENQMLQLMSLDQLGNIVWEKDILGDYFVINDLLETQTGDLILLGEESIDVNLPQEREFPVRSFLMKTDATGEPLWTQYLGNSISSFTSLMDILEMPDGSLAITGTIQYRNSYDVYLARTNADGMIVSINPTNQELSYDFEIFPNPNQGLFELSFEGKTNTGELTLTIFDATGRKSLEEKIHPLSQTLDLSHLSRGVYFLQLSDELQFGIKRLVID